jgi:hypothetical protein
VAVNGIADDVCQKAKEIKAIFAEIIAIYAIKDGLTSTCPRQFG